MTRLYFIKADKRIKIGISRDVEARLKEISIHFAKPPKLLGSIEHVRGLEKAVHERLKVYRLTGEWFMDCGPVRSVVADLIAFGSSAIQFIEPPRPKRREFTPRPPAPGFRGNLAKVFWGDDTALAEWARLSDESEEVVAKWMTGEVFPSPAGLLALIQGLFEALGKDYEWRKKNIGRGRPKPRRPRKGGV